MDILRKAHDSAINQVDLALDIEYLINLMMKYYLNEKTEEQIYEELKNRYKEPVEEYIRLFKRAAINGAVDKGMIKMLKNIGPNLSLDTFMNGRVAVLGMYVKSYLNGEMSREVFINSFMHDGINAVFIDFIIRNDININDVNEIIIAYKQGQLRLLAYAVLNELYKSFMDLMTEASMIHEQRLEIEAYCNQLIEEMIEYRKQVEEVVSDYLTNNIEIFQDSLQAMDQALLNNDTNGYIKANVKLQEALGVDIQFTTDEEFDEFMESDEDFNF